jgi:urease accessory protein
MQVGGMTAATLSNMSETFAANRAHGRVSLNVAKSDGVTRLARVHEEGSLRVRFPHVQADALEAMIINTAGGIAGGDRFGFDAAVGPEAKLVVTTAAAEKLYRSLGPDARIDVKLEVGPGGRLAWLPQETIFFDAARLSRTIDVELTGDATLILAEAVVFGRAAMGETVERGRLVDRWRVRRAGRLVFAETLRLDGPIAAKLAEPAVAHGAAAVATIVMVPGGEAEVEAVNAVDCFAGEVAISGWNGMAVVRFCAPEGASLRRDMSVALTALQVPLPRLWLK